MTRGLSIHIGVNVVNAGHYGPGVPELEGCVNDSATVSAIATAAGFDVSSQLLNEAATVAKVTSAIQSASGTLHAGDILLVFYAGHGAQVPDGNGDEDDGYDETWCLYDRMLVDDELYTLWNGFEAGVRILVISDSCHSGTVTRAMSLVESAMVLAPHPLTRAAKSVLPLPTKFRRLPREAEVYAYENNKQLYDAIQRENPQGDKAGVGATVLALAACQDNQLAGETNGAGTFTTGLNLVWNGGAFTGTYPQFFAKIIPLIHDAQTPKYTLVGAPNFLFQHQRPFTI